MSTKEETPQNIRDAFTRRLNLALREAGIDAYGSGVLIAETCGVTPKAAGKWLNAMSVPRSSKLAVLCGWLKVRREWLEYGIEPMKATASTTSEAARSEINEIPLINKESIFDFLNGHCVDGGDLANADIAKALGAGPKTFAYVETSEGMMHRIAPKDTIYIDPEAKIEPNSVGIFLFKLGSGFELGTLKSTPAGLMLQFDSNQPGWDSVKVSEDDYIGRLVAYVPSWLG